MGSNSLNDLSMGTVAFEFAEDNYKEGVRYFEVRFAPQLHSSINPQDHFGLREVLRAVNRGLRRAKGNFNTILSLAQSNGQRVFGNARSTATYETRTDGRQP